jgi:hypothetical protein
MDLFCAAIQPALRAELETRTSSMDPVNGLLSFRSVPIRKDHDGQPASQHARDGTSRMRYLAGFAPAFLSTSRAVLT